MSTMNPVPRLDTSQVASSLRAAFRTGRTRSVKWRLEQLHAIVKLLEENEEDIYWALDADLRKPRHEAFLSEVRSTFLHIRHEILTVICRVHRPSFTKHQYCNMELILL